MKLTVNSAESYFEAHVNLKSFATPIVSPYSTITRNDNHNRSKPMQLNAPVTVPNLNSLYTCDGNIMVLGFFPDFGGYGVSAAIPAICKQYMPDSVTVDGVTYAIKWHQVNAETAYTFVNIQTNNPGFFVPPHMLPRRKRTHLKSVK